MASTNVVLFMMMVAWLNVPLCPGRGAKALLLPGVDDGPAEHPYMLGSVHDTVQCGVLALHILVRWSAAVDARSSTSFLSCFWIMYHATETPPWCW